MEIEIRERVRGCAVGAAVGDALGMPLEFGPRRPVESIVREMQRGRLPAGTFTDDTEMALTLVDSLLVHCPLDPADLAQRFVEWYRAGPEDIGIHTRSVLSLVAAGERWVQAVETVRRQRPESAGNGSVMRCWPVAAVYWDDLEGLLSDSRLQSQVTHAHVECVAGSAFANAVLHGLLRGASAPTSITRALERVDMPQALRAVVEAAPGRRREELANSGWVRHTLESAVWGLATSNSFAEAVVRVVNLGNDADTAGAVVGAWAGAAYGLSAIPTEWREAVRGEWPLGSGVRWNAQDLVDVADRLMARRG